MSETPRSRPRGRSTRPDRSGASARAARGAATRSRRSTNRPSARRPAATPPTGTRWWRGGPPAAETGRESGPGRSRLVRQILALGLALVVAGVTLAVPWRNYVDASRIEAAALAQERQLEQQKRAFELKMEALSDPDYIKAEAKQRLQMVEPGVTVYVFRGPELPAEKPVSPTDTQPEQPWYSTLWNSLSVAENDNP